MRHKYLRLHNGPETERHPTSRMRIAQYATYLFINSWWHLRQSVERNLDKFPARKKKNKKNKNKKRKNQEMKWR